MKNKIIFFLLSLLIISACDQKDELSIEDGDLVFMRLDVPQMNSIKRLSKTNYTHVGVVFKQKDTIFVYEGANKVILSTMNKWIKRKSKDSIIIVKRLKKEHQTEKFATKLISAGLKFKNLPTDIVFDWSDTAMYSSELVWKMFDRGLGIQLCGLKKMRDWNTADEFVNQRLKKVYNLENPFNPETPVVSPDDIFNSAKLETVYTGKISFTTKSK